MTTEKQEEISVIKHYKKQLIYRQHDDVSEVPHQDNFLTERPSEDASSANGRNGSKTRRKRKNRNCRGQFRHEGIELIKLGTNTVATLCKNRNICNNLGHRSDEVPLGLHSLPQMVPERRNSRELPPNPFQCATNRGTSLKLVAPPSGECFTKLQPQASNLPAMERRAPVIKQYIPPPVIPVNHIHNPYPPIGKPGRGEVVHIKPRPASLNIEPKTGTPVFSFVKSPSPPYPLRHPPHPVVNPMDFTSYQSNGGRVGNLANLARLPSRPPPPYRPPCNKPIKRKLPQEAGENVNNNNAAIDLTMDNKNKTSSEQHKCKCQCGKPNSDCFTTPKNNGNKKSGPGSGGGVVQEIIIQVPEEFQNVSQVPIIKGRMINGVLEYDTPETTARNNNPPPTVVKTDKPSSQQQKTPILAKNANINTTPKSSQFLIENIITKDSNTRTNGKNVDPIITSRLIAPLPAFSRSPVIVANHRAARKSCDFNDIPSLANLSVCPANRRQSVEIDTISISSSSSGGEAAKSPTPTNIGNPRDTSAPSGGLERPLPLGKLCYLKTNNTLIRYFDDSQKRMFYQSLGAEGGDRRIQRDQGEAIQLPRNVRFSENESLDVEDYCREMTLVQEYIPKDFYAFYKFVTGYQILHNNAPVSFLTFLRLFSRNGLNNLLEKYKNKSKP